MLGLAGVATAGLGLPEAALAAQEAVRRGRPPLKIRDIKTILTQPGGEHLVVVKVQTSEPGLDGIGCATHGERPLAVAAAIDQHVRPLLIGKECDRI
jgi:L-alanine-DL-glutamate epimerase-like enolase superfamily enzyme